MHWRSASPEQTEALGARVAAARPRGASSPLIIYLSGDLGAGKTTFARGFLRECGVHSAVRSPTYTLIELYTTEDETLVHLDLYRLRDPSELEPLGLRDWARPQHIWLIEWPERASGELPPADLSIMLTVAVSAHELELTAGSAAGREWLARIDKA